ncbi:hypothetical protein [Massilia niastensis]|uniref:hypothetical protein n=1 Tax=Massilia niastensis TaxID=544911 RepID=UPI0003814F62|nr:hypothetical protein [Massilia niastensis]
MSPHVARLRAAGLAAALLTPSVFAQQQPTAGAAPAATEQELAVMKAELAAQRALVDKLVQEVKSQRAQLQRLQGDATPDAAAQRPGLAAGPRARPATDSILLLPGMGADVLAEQRGTGGAGTGQAPVAQPPVVQPTNPAAPRPAAAQDPVQAQQQNTSTRQRENRPPEVAPLFEQPGVLTPRGKFIFEPSLQFGYSSSNRVALVGYTVIPALLIGLVDVREIKRNTFTGALTIRTGLSNRMEVEAKMPYVYRSDATVSREIFTGTAVERVFNTSGRKIGDAELAARYQLNDGGPDKAFYIAGLRYKSRTGKDPFEVVTDCQTRCIGENVTGTGLPLSLPTGSGFQSVQGSLTWLYPSDPAVFFGNLSYVHNIKRTVERRVRGGLREALGELEPGNVIGFNFGMGLALNDKASLSLGYDHSTIARLRQNGSPVAGSVRTQLGTLLLGYSYRMNEKRTFNIAVGAGVTRDTPDVTLTVRIPMSF